MGRRRVRHLGPLLLLLGFVLLSLSLSDVMGTTSSSQEATETLSMSLTFSGTGRLSGTWSLPLPLAAEVNMTVLADHDGDFEVWAARLVGNRGFSRCEAQDLLVRETVLAFEAINVSFSSPEAECYLLRFSVKDTVADDRIQVGLTGNYRYVHQFFDPLRPASAALLAGFAAVAVSAVLLFMRPYA